MFNQEFVVYSYCYCFEYMYVYIILNKCIENLLKFSRKVNFIFKMFLEQSYVKGDMFLFIVKLMNSKKIIKERIIVLIMKIDVILNFKIYQRNMYGYLNI